MTASSSRSPGERPARAGAALLIALGVIALTLWGFAVLADAFREQGAIARLDTSVLNWLQVHGTERGERVFVAVSWLGSPVLFVVDASVAVWLAVHRNWRLFALWMCAILGGVILDEALKLAFHRARPAVASEFITTHSWSFPSGHAMNSLVGYATLAFLLRMHYTSSRARAAITLGAVLLIAAIGFSRLYLGVHYLSDVAAGYLAGTAWVVACIMVDRYAVRQSA